VLSGTDGRRAAADEKARFDVLGHPGLSEVGAGDQQDPAIGDGELGVHLRARLGPLRRRPVPELDAGNASKRAVGFVT
jgi:hypothetical protein